MLQPIKILFPFGWIYGLISKVRNRLYDTGFFESFTPDMLTVNVGNLSVGGTGKTPMVSFLIDYLVKNQIKVAILSRGYGRQTKGFRQVSSTSLAAEVGDESLQLASMYPNVSVVVCENRKIGIEQLLADFPSTQIIILDDAFQHRKIKAHFNFLLTPYYNLYPTDYYLPAGYLRDHKSRARQAESIVVTKCPPDLSSEEQLIIRKKLKPKDKQNVFFSAISYGSPKAVLNAIQEPFDKVVLVTGIANPTPLVEHLKQSQHILKHFNYPDHHPFKIKEINQWLKAVEKHENGVIVTTEKDWSRIQVFKDELQKKPVYVIPIALDFIPNRTLIDGVLNSLLQRIETSKSN